MTNYVLPDVLEKIFREDSQPEAVFSELMPALVEVLQCDRCFLYLRHPQKEIGKVAYCWRRSPDYPEILNPDWLEEPESYYQEDPLWAAAVRAEPSIFVEDVETASPDVLNKDFEHKNFGHRALVHAHIRFEEELWGILQPCVFGQPRKWTEFDHFVINTVTAKLAPLVVAFMKAVDFSEKTRF